MLWSVSILKTHSLLKITFLKLSCFREQENPHRSWNLVTGRNPATDGSGSPSLALTGTGGLSTWIPQPSGLWATLCREARPELASTAMLHHHRLQLSRGTCTGHFCEDKPRFQSSCQMWGPRTPGEVPLPFSSSKDSTEVLGPNLCYHGTGCSKPKMQPSSQTSTRCWLGQAGIHPDVTIVEGDRDIPEKEGNTLCHHPQEDTVGIRLL